MAKKKNSRAEMRKKFGVNNQSSPNRDKNAEEILYQNSKKDDNLKPKDLGNNWQAYDSSARNTLGLQSGISKFGKKS